jgi:hypothetical protein
MIEFHTVTPALFPAVSLPGFRIFSVSGALRARRLRCVSTANIENFTLGDESITLSPIGATLASPLTRCKLSARLSAMAGKQRAVAKVATKPLGALIQPLAQSF